MYEDDNETCRYEDDDCVKTMFTYTEAETAEFVIKPAQGNLSLIPGMRSYTIELHGFEEAISEEVSVTADGQMQHANVSYDKNMRAIIVQIPATNVTKEIKVKIDKNLCQLKNQTKDNCFQFLNQAEIDFFLKDQIFDLVQKERRLPILISRLHAMNMEEKLLAVLIEMLTAKTE